MPRITALLMLRSTIETVSAPAISPFRGSITHPTQPLCTLRGRRCRRLTQHSLPGGLLRPYLGRTCTGGSRQLCLAPSVGWVSAAPASGQIDALEPRVTQRLIRPREVSGYARNKRRAKIHSARAALPSQPMLLARPTSGLVGEGWGG